MSVWGGDGRRGRFSRRSLAKFLSVDVLLFFFLFFFNVFVYGLFCVGFVSCFFNVISLSVFLIYL